ncbi:hypothetical protein GCM10023339_41200 [Alloalcanivorax gelatiniphagus]
MALIVVFSAGGSPGCTTTALALSMTWHRPVLLVEADPSGASAVLAGYFRGDHAPAGGLINLALAHRDGTLADVLPRETLVLDRPTPASSPVWFLPGVRSHEQSLSLIPLWEPLAEQLRAMHQHGQDVIVDAGRLGLTGWPRPLIVSADLALLVTRTSLPALAAARSWAETLRTDFAATGGASRLGAFTVDEDHRWPVLPTVVPRVRPYTNRQIGKALELPVVASVPWEPEVAEVYSHGARRPRKFATSGLQSSYKASADAISARIAANQAMLASATGDRS